jgi:hypothetical protein
VKTRAPKLLLIACGALAREIAALRRLGGWDHVESQRVGLEPFERALAAAGVRAQGAEGTAS